MRQLVEIYLHTEGNEAVKLVKASEEDTLREIAAREGVKETGECSFFLEDQEAEISASETLKKTELKQRQHIHCHRCKKIKVIVSYNGRPVEKAFTPSTTGKQVMRWALKEFGVSGTDFVLVIDGSTRELESTDHVGSFATFPACAVKLLLTAKVAVAG